ncbi:MAG: peptidoglycan DD-metalloendopeptidase family protein [Mariprofundaceae bacterium]|nr:peptidoglycan DD-metalloendopeptidase family protein [Mariprofundaceae bacterium]
MRLFSIPLVLALLCAFAWPVDLVFSADTKMQLKEVRQQRAALTRLREQLEARLGDLGAVLKKADGALVEASRESKRARQDVRSTDEHISVLKARQIELKNKAGALKKSMQREAALAYRQADQSSLWLDMLLGAEVADIPHRQYLLARLVQQQRQDRMDYVRTRSELAVTQSELMTQRRELEALRVEKDKRWQSLRAAREDKQSLWNKVKHDARLKAERDAQLARQESALKKLLKGMGSTLLKADGGADWKPMRQQKGKLAWPIDGRIVAGFHSRTFEGRPRLAGVQLAPRRSGGQVKAVAAGHVRYADWFGGYGLMMIVDHGDGLMTVYAHNDALYKQLGDWVAEGDVLADPGSTGWVQDTRLYFEVRDAGRPVNPKRWCRRKG